MIKKEDKKLVEKTLKALRTLSVSVDKMDKACTDDFPVIKEMMPFLVHEIQSLQGVINIYVSQFEKLRK